MQLLCSSGAFSRNPDFTNHHQVLAYAPFLDVDGFELMFYENWYAQFDVIVQDLQRSGLHFPAIHAEKNIGMALGSSQAERREQAVQWLSANCEMAQRLGSAVLVLHLWGWPELDDHLDYNLEPLHRCLDVAARYNVQLAIETIPARHADPLTNVHKAIERDGRCYVALDTEFLGQSGQLESVFTTPWVWEELNGQQRVRHIHIKDFDGLPFSDGRRRYLHPGEGFVDFERFFAALKQRQFDGNISLESPAIDHEGHVDIERLQRSLAMIRRMML